MFARSTNPGNSRASERGTGSKYGSHAFLFFNQSNAKEGSPAATILNMPSIYINQIIDWNHILGEPYAFILAIFSLCISIYTITVKSHDRIDDIIIKAINENSICNRDICVKLPHLDEEYFSESETPYIGDTLFKKLLEIHRQLVYNIDNKACQEEYSHHNAQNGLIAFDETKLQRYKSEYETQKAYNELYHMHNTRYLYHFYNINTIFDKLFRMDVSSRSRVIALKIIERHPEIQQSYKTTLNIRDLINMRYKSKFPRRIKEKKLMQELFSISLMRFQSTFFNLAKY